MKTNDNPFVKEILKGKILFDHNYGKVSNDRPRNEPKTLQQNNRQKAINNLRDVHAVIERLMNKTYRQQDVTESSALRQMRTSVTALLSEMENKGLDTFSGRAGTLDEFYNAEERFTESSTRLIKAAEDAEVTDENVDVFSLENLVDTLERGFNNRIILTQEHLREYEKLRTWSRKVDTTEHGIRGVVKDGMFKTPLVFETYWKPLHT